MEKNKEFSNKNAVHQLVLVFKKVVKEKWKDVFHNLPIATIHH